MNPELTRITRGMFAQFVILLCLYALVNLIGAAQFWDDSALWRIVPYQHINAFTTLLLHIAVLTGLIGGGLYIITPEETRENGLPINTILRYGALGWRIFLIAAVLVGVFDLFARGATLHDLPLLLELVRIALVLLFFVIAGVGVKNLDAPKLMWFVAVGILLAAMLIGLFTSPNYLQNIVMRTLANGLTVNVGYVLGTLALTGWYIGRHSTVPAEWFASRLYLSAGLLTLAGGLVSVAPLHTLNQSDLLNGLGIFGAVFIPFSVLVFAAFSYRSLTHHKPDDVPGLAWIVLSALTLILSVGVLGGLASLPAVNQWTQGTRVSDLQTFLTILAAMFALIGMSQEFSADILALHQHRSIEFWLVAVGTAAAGFALAAAGLVQIYLERVLGIGYLDTQTHITPLYAAWIVGLVVLAVGVLIYTAQYVLNRKQKQGERS